MFSEIGFSVQCQQANSPKPLQQPPKRKPVWVFRPTHAFTQDYTLLDCIGGGAYGKVYCCCPKNAPDEIYAVKIISKYHFKQDLDLFRHEIAIMQILKHPNLIQFITMYENETYLYIVMEYLPEGDLFTLLTRHFPTEINQVQNPLPFLLPTPPTTSLPIPPGVLSTQLPLQLENNNNNLLPQQHQHQHQLLPGSPHLPHYNPDLEPSRIVPKQSQQPQQPRQQHQQQKANKKDSQFQTKSKKKSSFICCGCCCGSDDEKDGENLANKPPNTHTNSQTSPLSNESIKKLTLQAKKTYTERDVADWIYQIALGLEYLHAKNIVHADIKPENILVKLADQTKETETNQNNSNNSLVYPHQQDQDQTQHQKIDKKTAKMIRKSRKRYHCKIIDFGLSSLVERRHIIVSQDGSPEYMSPEVIRGKYTVHSDMWSLGILLFNLLFGFTPFMAYNVVDTLKLIETQGFRPDSPTPDHCNSFPEYFIGGKTDDKTKKESQKLKKTKKNLKKQQEQEQEQETNSIQTTIKNKNDKKYTKDGLDEPLLIRVSFDDNDDSDINPKKKQKAGPNGSTNDEEEEDPDVFKSSVKPGTYNKSVQQIVCEQYANLIPNISSYAKDLICRLLVQDPLQRLSATEVLQHPWFVKCSKYKNKNIFQLRDQPHENSKNSFLGNLFGSRSVNNSFSSSVSRPNFFNVLSSQSSSSLSHELINTQQQQPNFNNSASHFFSTAGASGLNPLQQYSTRTKLKRALLHSLVEQLTEDDIRNWKKRLLFFNEQQIFQSRGLDSPNNDNIDDNSNTLLTTSQTHNLIHNSNTSSVNQLASINSQFSQSPTLPGLTSSSNTLNEDDEVNTTDNYDNQTYQVQSDALSYNSYNTISSTMTGATLSIAPSNTSVATTTPYWKVGSLNVIKLFNQSGDQNGAKNSLMQSSSLFAGGQPPSSRINSNIVHNTNPTQQSTQAIQSTPISPITSPHNSNTPPLSTAGSNPSMDFSSRAGDTTPPSISLNKIASRNRLQAFAAPRLQATTSLAHPPLFSKTPDLQPHSSESAFTTSNLQPNYHISPKASTEIGSATDFIASSSNTLQDISPILPIASHSGNNTPSPLSTGTSSPLNNATSSASNFVLSSSLNQNDSPQFTPLQTMTSPVSSDDKITRLMNELNISNEELIDLIMCSLEQKLLQKEDRLYALFDAIQSSNLNEQQSRKKNTTAVPSRGPQTGNGFLTTTQLSHYLHISPSEAHSMIKEGILYLKTIHDEETVAIKRLELQTNTNQEENGTDNNSVSTNPSQLLQSNSLSGLINSPSSLGNDQLEKSLSFIQTHQLNTDVINFNDELGEFEQKLNQLGELRLNADQFIALFSLQEQQQEPSFDDLNFSPNQSGDQLSPVFAHSQQLTHPSEESYDNQDCLSQNVSQNNMSPIPGSASNRSTATKFVEHKNSFQLQNQDFTKQSFQINDESSDNFPTQTNTSTNTPTYNSAVLLELDPLTIPNLPSKQTPYIETTSSNPNNYPISHNQQNIVNIGPFGDNPSGNIYQYDDFNSEIDENESIKAHDKLLPFDSLNTSPNVSGNNNNDYLIDIDQFSEINQNDTYFDDIYETYSNVLTTEEYLALPLNPFQQHKSVTGTGSAQSGYTGFDLHPVHAVPSLNNLNNQVSNPNNQSQQHLPYHHTPPLGAMDTSQNNHMNYNSNNSNNNMNHARGKFTTALSSQPHTNQPQQSQLYKQSSRFGHQPVIHNPHHNPQQYFPSPPITNNNNFVQNHRNGSHFTDNSVDLDVALDLTIDDLNQFPTTTQTPPNGSKPITMTMAMTLDATTPPPNSSGVSSSYRDSTKTAFNAHLLPKPLLGTQQQHGQVSSYNQFGNGLTSHYVKQGQQHTGSSFTPTFNMGSFTNSYLPQNSPHSLNNNSNHIPVANLSIQTAMDSQYTPQTKTNPNGSTDSQPSLLSIAQKRLEFQQQENIISSPILDSNNGRNSTKSNLQ